MKRLECIMGMPVMVDIAESAPDSVGDRIMDYFRWVDRIFSPFKPDSEISRINRHELHPREAHAEVQQILRLGDETKRQTLGYFDMYFHGHLDPSGIVKGWAIHNAANLLRREGYKNFYVEAGGDIEVSGTNHSGTPWRIGIRNPNNTAEIVKILALTNAGIATSGTYERGDHVYNPRALHGRRSSSVVSLTVIGRDIYDADRMATAAFAMGDFGINFLSEQPNLEAYSIDIRGRALYTPGFERFVAHNEYH